MDFLDPYIIFCGSAAYSLMQNMESLGWVSFWKGIYIDPQSTFKIFLGAYILSLPIIVLLNIFASFSLNRNIGVLSILLWLAPGLLSLLGINIIYADVPDSYILNGGSMYVGETKSTLYNVFLIFLLGWSLTTLIVHVFKIRTKFKESYDHLWYVLGLAAAVIFVVDSNTSYYKTEFSESEKNISKVLSLTVSQLDYAHSVCLKKHNELHKKGISREFCGWVDNTKNSYFWLSEDSGFTRNLKSKNEILEMIPIERISDISKFNELICESKTESSNCNPLSFNFGRFTEDFDWPNSRFALAIVPLNKSLSVFWEQSSKNHEKLNVAQKTPNTKWFFYMLLGFIAGGKVANSSRSLAGEPEPIFRFWITSSYKCLINFFPFVKKKFIRLLGLIKSVLKLFAKIPFNK